MKKYILLFLLVLLFFNGHNTPFWTQESASVTSGSQYSPSKNYGFQINWTDSVQGIGGISSAIFESNFSGSLYNYTSGTTPAVQNNTEGIYWINFTGVKAGNYVYRWYANDTSNNFNLTDQFSYSIAKNTTSIVLKINGTQSNKSFSFNGTASFNVTLAVPGKTVYLNSSYPAWSLLSNTSSFLYNETKLTENGTFSVRAYWDGDENYSSSEMTYYFDDTPPQFSNDVTYPTIPTYVPNATYYFNISWSDVKLNNVWFESNHTETLHNYSYPDVQNQSGVFWINLTDLKGVNFYYRWIAQDDAGKVNNTTATLYVVQKAYALSFIAPIFDITVGNLVTVVCYSNTYQINVNSFNLYRNDTLIPNTSMLSRDESVALGIGTYSYVCNTTGNANYTNQTSGRTVNVVSSSGSPGGGAPPVKEFKITQISSPTIAKGASGEGTFNLSNTLDETLVNFFVNITGINPLWFTIENVPSALLKGGNVIISVKFHLPSDAEVKTYNITIKVTGDIQGTTGKRTVTQYMTLSVTAAPPISNEPPSYSGSSFNNTIAGQPTLFSLDWEDDRGLGFFIFSTNNSGVWLNDSQKSLSGTEDTSSAEKNLTSEVGKIIAWKFYASDTDGAWTVSEEFYLVTVGEEERGFDFTIVIIVIIVIIVAVAAFLFLRARPVKPEPKVEYYYGRDNVK